MQCRDGTPLFDAGSCLPCRPSHASHCRPSKIALLVGLVLAFPSVTGSVRTAGRKPSRWAEGPIVTHDEDDDDDDVDDEDEDIHRGTTREKNDDLPSRTQ